MNTYVDEVMLFAYSFLMRGEQSRFRGFALSEQDCRHFLQ